MKESDGTSFRNRVLAMLSHADHDLLTPELETVDLSFRQILETPNDPISHAYFLESGLVSVIGVAPPHHRIEIGMVGYEGMSGVSIVLGGDRSVNETLVQTPGSAMRISTESLRGVLGASRSLTATLLRYVSVFMTQCSQTALANGRGLRDERLARWLLMWHDRIEGDTLTVTHDFLAQLMGVHRSAVTEALHGLEDNGLIRTTRSQVHIRDRNGLQLAANGFYGIPEAEYARLMVPEGRTPPRPRSMNAATRSA
jgi:CRP-like cAMP-binding protein